MNFLRSGISLTTISFSKQLLSFSGVVLLANITSPGELGIFFLFVATVGILSIPAGLGINGAVEKRISEGEKGDTVIGTAIYCKIITLALLCIVIVIFSGYINSYVGAEIVYLLIVCLVFKELSHLMFRVLRGERRVATAALLQFIQTAIWIFGALFASFLGYGAQGIIISYLVSYVFMGWIGATIQQTGIATFSRNQFFSIYNYAKHNFITSIGGQVYVYMDTLMLGLFVNPGLIAAYEIAWRISKVGLIVSRSVSQTTFPQISAWSEEGNLQAISSTLSVSFIPGFIIVIPAFFGTLVLSSDILRIIYGEAYVIAGGTFIILAGERVIKAGTQIISRGLHALNKPGLSAKATISAIIANIILNWFLIQEFGIIGAALGTTFSFTIKFLMEYRYLQSLVRVQIPWREIITMLCSSIVMASFLYYIKNLTPGMSILKLLLLISMSAITYFMIAIIEPTIRKQIISGLQEVLEMTIG